MTIAQIISLLEATSLSDTPDLEHTIESVCGSDMMSDVLAFIKKDALLLTGLITCRSSAPLRCLILSVWSLYGANNLSRRCCRWLKISA